MRTHLDLAMTRSEREAIAVDSAKRAADAQCHELLRLKKKVEDELKAKAIAADDHGPSGLREPD